MLQAPRGDNHVWTVDLARIEARRLLGQMAAGINPNAKVRSVRALPISLAQKRAVVAFVDRELTNRDHAALNAVDREVAYRDLADLADRGLVEVQGTGAGTTDRVLRTAVPAPSPTTPMGRMVARMAEVNPDLLT